MANKFLEYEKPEFMDFVRSVITIKETYGEVIYRGAYRWHSENGDAISNGYEMFAAQSIAQTIGKKIERFYGEHCFVCVDAEQFELSNHRRTLEEKYCSRFTNEQLEQLIAKGGE